MKRFTAFSTKTLLVAMMGIGGYAQLAMADDPVKGTITAVTVYRGQALVTRAVDLPAKAGLTEIVVTELPDRLLPGSLFAEADGGVEVRSVSYRERAVAKDVREAVQKLDDQIKALTDKIAGNNVQKQLLAEQKAYLEKLANFTAPTATTEMSKGVLNAEQLKSLTDYQFQQRKAISEQELALSLAARELQEQLNLAQRQKYETSGGSSKTLREAVVFVNQPGAGGKLRLRYLVDGANWMPSYNIRADAEKKNANLEYQASIQQMSGEDWGDVTMTLSTASPSLVASAPVLNPLTIALAVRDKAVAEGVGKEEYDKIKAQYAQEKSEIAAARSITITNSAASNIINPSPIVSGTGTLSLNNVGGNTFTGTINNGGNMNFIGGANAYGGNTVLSGGRLVVANAQDSNLNRVADREQMLELVAKETKKDPSQLTVQGEGIVVTYTLKNATSLPSRADRQLIQIKSVALKSDFYKIAVPVLTNYVYDEAALTNNGETVLLAGPVASYVGGQFVGNGEIPTVAAGQTFTVGFGIDSSLRATRTPVDKVETTQGGNKVVNYSYKIAIENYGAAAANVRVLDREPTAKETEVKITFEAGKDKLSEDKDYQQFDRKKGILRWDVSVPPQLKRAEAFSIDYKLQMQYDKNLAILAGGVAGAPIK
jgi:hypothetical protein